MEYLFLLIPILLLLLLYLLLIDKYKFHFHEYGHVLKIIENLAEDIDNYKKETDSNKIKIQVISFTKPFGLIPEKRKTYSDDYFTYLEKNAKDVKYQNIIKDISINGYIFSKKFIEQKTFCILRIIFSITVGIIIFSICNLSLFPTLIISISSFIISYICFIIFYIKLCEAGYGKEELSEKGMSDNYIYHHPEKFKYTSFDEDTKQIKANYKIILDIDIELNSIKNLNKNIILQDRTYSKITNKFPF